MKFSASLLASAVLLTSNSLINLASAGPTFTRDKHNPLRFLSYNVRYDSQSNDITVQQTLDSLPAGLPIQPSPYYGRTGERAWSERRIGVVNDILWPNVDIVGLQEVLTRQVEDIQELLGEGWGHVGIGRDDGVKAGEYSAIFWKKSSVQLVSWDTFWLSETPFEPSKYADAGSYRSCTTAQFKSSLGRFTLLNSHLDNSSDNQRRLAASLMLHRAKHEALKTRRPVFLTGDFNSPPSGPDGGAYAITTGTLPPLAINSTFTAKYSWKPKEEWTFALVDLAVEAKARYRSGEFATYTGFKAPGDASSFGRIDYLFGGRVEGGEGWGVESYRVGAALYDDGSWNSDHRPVYADISMEK